ncbi:TonB-dependent receptor [Terriglobus roseus]|uniref:Carboxypeptidase regulatory-like domain-containing protein n=1 Tax=Terriglobus roseus TaxID=392734 RepID=A0A1H4JQG0_9BACT|nr:TonB-dependent receptor [Terriglobus roseus]SEB48531.1 Carboxypeptidase regulatory-like domain-containing protein [Terriglobus roseus]
MNQSLFALAAGVAPALAFSTTAPAQTGCTPVAGVVHDATSAIIPGASVRLDSNDAVLGDAYGRFRIACVPAGRHMLHITFDGFSSVDLPVSVPRAADLAVRMVPAVVTTSVDVSDNDDDPAAENSPVSTGPTQTIKGQQLQSLADDPDDLLRELQQMAAAGGGSPSSATVSVDGFQGGDNHVTLPPKSSIAYIKVNPDLFSSEYRNPPFGGGQIEVYTKPGQSAYHGAVFTTNSSAWMNARDPFSVTRAAIGKQRYGFELTGPIRSKGSDFILNLEHRSIDNFATVNAVGVNAAGVQTAILQNVPAPQRLWVGMAKVDWQLGSKNTLIASFDAWHNHRENVGAGGSTLAEGAYDGELYDHNVHLTDVTTLSAKAMHEARLGIEIDGRDQVPNSFKPQLQVAGAFTSGGNSDGALRDHEVDAEFDDDVIFNFSKHLLKVGFQSEFLRERFRYTNKFNGSWIFGGGTAPVLDANHNATAGSETITGVEQYVRALNGWAGGAPTQYSNVSGTPTLNMTQYRFAFFVQDDWKVLPRLHVALGLRYYTQNKPMVHNNINPRLGISWAPDKKSTWTLHAHAGLFSGRFTAHSFAQLLGMDGTDRVTSLIYSPMCPGSFDPDTCNAFLGATPLQSIRTIQPHLPNLFYGIENIGFSHTIGKGWTISADYHLAQFWHYTRTENINAPTNGDPLGPRPLQPNVNILQWQPTARGYGNVVFMGLSNQSLKRVQLTIGSTRQAIIDENNDDPFTAPQTTGSNAGEFARRAGNALWNVFGNATAKLPWALQLSGNLNAQGDRLFNITTGFDNNGDGNFNDRPRLAATGTPICSASVTSNCGYRTPYGFLATAGAGPTLGRNAGHMPWTFNLDTNLQRTFKLRHDAKAEHPQSLTANVRSSNVLNHRNVSSVGSVVGSPLFNQPYQADNGRRVEGGLRYSF